ncbi:hypothetical protein TNCT_96961 [Trichonephila clavata]|uniref:Uncharacterized protein n=1 Tax=Trichonephila clavata TaxID=2740835 RepID=A0A8X6J7Y3_TRICU|nr:hypothetical protein TNCT_96961 [Trichonephila clavata]
MRRYSFRCHLIQQNLLDRSWKTSKNPGENIVNSIYFCNDLSTVTNDARNVDLLQHYLGYSFWFKKCSLSYIERRVKKKVNARIRKSLLKNQILQCLDIHPNQVMVLMTLNHHLMDTHHSNHTIHPHHNLASPHQQ